MIEPLENRRLCAADTSGVALFDAAGAPATINRHAAAWLLVHGANMSKDLMTDMAQAVAAGLPAGGWQVLIVDWSTLARSNASGNAPAVGDRVAAMIHAAKLPASRVNLIGFSLGGTVVDQIARDLKSQTAQVNRVVGIDARIGSPDYAENSSYSIAFGARDGLGKEAGTLAADDAVYLSGLTGSDLPRHADTFSVLTTVWKRDAGLISKGSDGVSPLFSIQSILADTHPAWRKDRFLGDYDAQLNCGYQPGLAHDLGPLSLTYVDRRGHTRSIT